MFQTLKKITSRVLNKKLKASKSKQVFFRAFVVALTFFFIPFLFTETVFAKVGESDGKQILLIAPDGSSGIYMMDWYGLPYDRITVTQLESNQNLLKDTDGDWKYDAIIMYDHEGTSLVNADDYVANAVFNGANLLFYERHLAYSNFEGKICSDVFNLSSCSLTWVDSAKNLTVRTDNQLITKPYSINETINYLVSAGINESHLGARATSILAEANGNNVAVLTSTYGASTRNVAIQSGAGSGFTYNGNSAFILINSLLYVIGEKSALVGSPALVTVRVDDVGEDTGSRTISQMADIFIENNFTQSTLGVHSESMDETEWLQAKASYDRGMSFVLHRNTDGLSELNANALIDEWENFISQYSIGNEKSFIFGNHAFDAGMYVASVSRGYDIISQCENQAGSTIWAWKPFYNPTGLGARFCIDYINDAPNFFSLYQDYENNGSAPSMLPSLSLFLPYIYYVDHHNSWSATTDTNLQIQGQNYSRWGWRSRTLGYSGRLARSNYSINIDSIKDTGSALVLTVTGDISNTGTLVVNLGDKNISGLEGGFLDSWYKDDKRNIYYVFLAPGNYSGQQLTISYGSTESTTARVEDDGGLLISTTSNASDKFTITFDTDMDLTRTVTLANVGSPVWDAKSSQGVSTTITPSNSIYFPARSDESNQYHALKDLSILPSSDSITAEILDWNPTSKRWTETATSGVTSLHTIRGLTTNKGYQVKVDGSVYTTITSDDSGQISFNYTGGYSTKTFEIEEYSAPSATPIQAPTSESTPTSASAPTCDATTPSKAPWLYGASAKSSSSILLQFSEAGDPVSEYVLEYGTEAGNYRFSAANIGGKDTRSYLVESLSPDTTYHFRVRASNGCATGEWSNAISAKTFSTYLTSISNNNSLITEITETDVKEKEQQQKEDQAEDKSETKSDETTGQVLGVNVKIKVVDEDKKPVGGAKVTLYSTPREATTNEEGVATFEGVEPGEHRAVIAYKVQTGEQKINVPESGEVGEIDFTIQIKSTSPFTSFPVMVVIGLLSLGFVTLLIILLRIKSRS